jgi:replicative superfamily II helicase
MKCIIVDIDSTIAQKVSRHHYEWHRVGEDAPIVEVIDLIKSYPHKIIILTARNEGFPATPKNKAKFNQLSDDEIRMIGRVETERWIATHVGDVERIIMKPCDSFENATLFKQKAYHALVDEGWDVEYIVDDNPDVCNMFQNEEGLLVLRVMISA